MLIKYTLVKNQVNGVDGYKGVVRHAGSLGVEDVVDQIIRQGSTVTRADVVSVLANYYAALEALLRRGFRVNTPFANFGLGIRGVFETTEDGFDHHRHRLLAKVSAGKRLRKVFDGLAQVVRKVSDVPRPVLKEYVDVATGERNGALTPGGVGRLLGDCLKFDPADEAQGVFVVGEDGGEVRARTMVHNVPGELIFVLPDSLPPGSCRLTVRAIFGAGDLRSGVLSAPLQVRTAPPARSGGWMQG